MKTVQYFPHDYDARHDEKLTKLRRVLGGEGLGVYWCVIECLYNGDGKLPLSAIEDISYDLRFDVSIVEKVIKDFDLFQSNNTHFWSNGVISRLRERKNISDKRREAALAKYRKKDSSDANAQQMESKSNANEMQMLCNINIKDKNIKDKNKKEEIENIIIEDKSSLSTLVDAEVLEEDKTPNEIVTFYNNSVKGSNIPKCIKLTETRKKAVKARLKEFGKDNIYLAITKAVQSKFLNGSNDRDWHADFDWVFNAKNMAKILECKYDDKQGYGTDRKDNQTRALRAGVGAFQQLWEERNREQGTDGVS